MNEMFPHSQEELILAGQKLRTVWKGYLVTLVTLLVTIVVLLAALMGVAANPFVGGGTAVVVLILLIISLICLIVGGVMTLVGLYGDRSAGSHAGLHQGALPGEHFPGGGADRGHRGAVRIPQLSQQGRPGAGQRLRHGKRGGAWAPPPFSL